MLWGKLITALLDRDEHISVYWLSILKLFTRKKVVADELFGRWIRSLCCSKEHLCQKYGAVATQVDLELLG